MRPENVFDEEWREREKKEEEEGVESMVDGQHNQGGKLGRMISLCTCSSSYYRSLFHEDEIVSSVRSTVDLFCRWALQGFFL